jgi:hypothetical protein
MSFRFLIKGIFKEGKMKTLSKFLILIFIFGMPFSFAGKWEKRGEVYITDEGSRITSRGMKDDIYDFKGKTVYIKEFKEEGGRVFAIICERPSCNGPSQKVPADQVIRVVGGRQQHQPSN